MKVVINRCYGGFSLSAQAVAEIAKLRGKTAYFFESKILSGGIGFEHVPVTIKQADNRNVYVFNAFDSPDVDFKDNEAFLRHEIDVRPDDRADPDLVRVVEKLGAAANGKHAELAVVEIPDGTDYVVEEYDGLEWIAEAHRTWR